MSKLYQSEIKGIKLLQDRARDISEQHNFIADDLDYIKNQLTQLGGDAVCKSPEFEERKQQHLDSMPHGNQLNEIDSSTIYRTANTLYPQQLGLTDILSTSDFEKIDKRLNNHIQDFNNRYKLDEWDYAIAGSCGLFAGMLDVLCIKAPPKPTVSYSKQVDGVFNRWVQNAFNKVLPEDVSKALEAAKEYKAGSADASTVRSLIGAPRKTLSPVNHRLRALSHDPVLGLIFGVKDMMNGTCTVIQPDGTIKAFKGVSGTTEGNVFQLLGRMFGHLLSDVNTPSGKGNRGMGLPAPFMGLLRMFEGIELPKKIGDSAAGTSTFGKQIEWMYVNGYDFRQFMVTSIPLTIMEVLLRVFYTMKQMNVYDIPFGEAMLETMPLNINPRFRMILALSYGTVAAVNSGKVYCTQNILNANYSAWMGLAWNTFHALKWALVQKHFDMWEEIEKKEIQELEKVVDHIDTLKDRASQLPT